MAEYGLRSLDPSQFEIADHSYHPVFEKFDLGFDLAASDLIRLIWAYLVGLLEAAREHSTNHPGVLILDEPQQQNVKDLSFESFLSRLALCKDSDQQAVIAMSKVPPELLSRASELGVNVRLVDGWVLKKMNARTLQN